eukprot:2616950-Pleurochrysis_carterae.AAC.1
MPSLLHLDLRDAFEHSRMRERSRRAARVLGCAGARMSAASICARACMCVRESACVPCLRVRGCVGASARVRVRACAGACFRVRAQAQAQAQAQAHAFVRRRRRRRGRTVLRVSAHGRARMHAC